MRIKLNTKDVSRLAGLLLCASALSASCDEYEQDILLNAMLKNDRLALWRRDYRVGTIISEFVARNIRRDIEIIDVLRKSKAAHAKQQRTQRKTKNGWSCSAWRLCDFA